MLKKFLAAVVAVCMLAGCTACQVSEGREQSSAVNGQAPKEAGSEGLTVYDPSGKDISAEVLRLWKQANEIYNVDDSVLFDIDWDAPVLLSEDAPAYFELKDYDKIVDSVFSPKGKEQLEQTRIGGSAAFIQKKDGKVYRMGPWKTGISFADGLVSLEALDASEKEMMLHVEYSVERFEGSYVDGEADFTIVNIDGAWLVDNYVYPEAQKEDSSFTVG